MRQQNYTASAGSSASMSMRDPPKNIYQQERDKWSAIRAEKRAQRGDKSYTNLAVSDPSRYYCDLCKVSCAGHQTYSAHQVGARHKKREAEVRAAASAAASGTSAPASTTLPLYRCELCESPCTSLDTFLAHLKGQKHLKVLLQYLLIHLLKSCYSLILCMLFIKQNHNTFLNSMPSNCEP